MSRSNYVKYRERDAGKHLVHLDGGNGDCSGRRYDCQWEESARRRKACTPELWTLSVVPLVGWYVLHMMNQPFTNQSYCCLSKGAAAIRDISTRKAF
jgi:hypothetical protein